MAVTVEEIKVKFSAEINQFKKGLETVKGALTKVSDSMEDLDGDIKRATSSSNERINKIGKNLDSENNKYKKASEAAKKYSNEIANIGTKYNVASEQANVFKNQIQSQEKAIEQMRNDAQILAGVLGKFNISSSIDEELDGMGMRLEKNKQKAQEIENKMRELSQSKYDLIEFDGSYATIEQLQLALDNLDNDSEQTYNKMNRLKDAIQGMSEAGIEMGSEKGLKKLNQQIGIAESKLVSLKTKETANAGAMDGFRAKTAALTGKLAQQQSIIGSTSARIMALRSAMGLLSSTKVGSFIANMVSTCVNLGNAVSSLIHRFANGISKVRQFGSAILGGSKQVVGFGMKCSILGGAITRLKNKFTNFGQKFTQTMRMVKSIVLSMVLMQLFVGFGEILGDMSKKSERMNIALTQVTSAFKYLRNAIMAAFEPMLSYVAPIISKVIIMVGDACNKLAEFFAALSGQKTYTKAVYVQEDYADSLDKATDSANNAAEANENLKKSVLGFDEITKLDDNTSTSNSGTSGSDSSSDGATGHWEETAVNVQGGILDAIKNGDWYEVGVQLGEKLNEALASINWDKIQNTVNGFSKKLANFLNGMVDGIDWDLVGYTFGQGINTVLGGIDTFLTTFNWQKAGESLAKCLNGMVKTIDWDLLGKTFGDSIEASIDLGFGFVETFDFKTFGDALSNSVNSCFGAIDFKKAGKTLGDGIIGLFDGITSFFDGVDWDKIGGDVVDFVMSVDWVGLIFSALKAAISVSSAVVEFVLGMVEAIGKNIVSTDWGQVAKNIWTGIKESFTKLDDKLLEIGIKIAGDLNKIWYAFCDGVSLVVTAGVSLVKDGWESITGWIGEKTDVIVAKVSAIKDSAFDKIKSTWDSWKDKASTLTAKASNAASSVLSGLQTSWNTISNKTSTLTGKAVNATSKTLSTIKSAWGSLKSKSATLKSYFKNQSSGTLKTLKSAWNTFSNKSATLTAKFKDFFSVPLKKAWNAVANGINKGISVINKIPGVHVSKVYTFAKGGFPTRGQMFVANEAGAEMVGSMDGKTAVANNQQIVQGIKAGVYQAMVQANSNNKSTQPTQLNVYVGGTQITDTVVKDINNRTIATGKSPILV